MTEKFESCTNTTKAIVVERSVMEKGAAFIGHERDGVREVGVHLTGTDVHGLIEALKPFAVEPDPLADWERELLEGVEAEKKPAFEVGDVVRLSGPHYIADTQKDRTYDEAPHGLGSLGTVTSMSEVYGKGAAVHVRWKGVSRGSVVATSSLSLWEPEFEVGQRVTIKRTDDDGDRSGLRIASRAKVVAVSDTEDRYEIEDDGTNFPGFRFEGSRSVKEGALRQTPEGMTDRDQGYLTPATPALPEVGSTVRLVPKTRSFSAKEGSLAVVEKVDPSRWGGVPAISVRWISETPQSPGFYGAADFQPFEAEEPGDVTGSIVYVTGDSDDWSHDFEPGTAVKILQDDVEVDGSYLVRGVKTGTEQYVGANDVALESPHSQKIANGTKVRITNDGHESGLRHYLRTGTVATVKGWTDTSAEEGSEYDETYTVEGAPEDGLLVSGTLVQSVTPDSIEVDPLIEYAEKIQEEAARVARAARFSQRYLTGINPATRVDWRDPAVRTFGRRRCVCGSSTCLIGPMR